jgi:ribonucleoside-diphosphate reductase alpha chain
MLDPITTKLIALGVPWEPSAQNSNEAVFSFPIQNTSQMRVGQTYAHSLSARSQLELWKTYADNYCEHKPSISVYVDESEWPSTAGWCYDNWRRLNGVSFFPLDDHIYPQAPYQRVTKEVYEEMIKKMPTDINFTIEEDEDTTTNSQELACSAGSCEI